MVLRFAAVMHHRNVLGIPVGIPVPAAPAHSFDWAFEGVSHIEACTRSMSTDIVTQQDRRGVVYWFGEATTRTYGLDGMVPTSSS
jgi:hypothetical protein